MFKNDSFGNRHQLVLDAARQLKGFSFHTIFGAADTGGDILVTGWYFLLPHKFQLYQEHIRNPAIKPPDHTMTGNVVYTQLTDPREPLTEDQALKMALEDSLYNFTTTIANYLYSPAANLLTDEPEALRAGVPQKRLAEELLIEIWPIAEKRFKDIWKIVLPEKKVVEEDD